MATIECKAFRPGIPPTWVVVDDIADEEVVAARAWLDEQIAAHHEQISTVVALAFLRVAEACPAANPSDLWQHVIYRHLIEHHVSDNQWKRISGFALERALAHLYRPRLAPYGLRMQILPAAEANRLLNRIGITTRATKIDMFLEGMTGTRIEGLLPVAEWVVFGAAHVKASIAERIQDDVPASSAFMEQRLLSVALTMDSKSSPPPGNCINYGEFGGRSVGIEKERLKRGYIETTGQFDGLFSFNLRTPRSPPMTRSGKRIYTMSLHESQPDQLVRFLIDSWANYKTAISI